MVGNLPNKTGKVDIETHFRVCGEIIKITNKFGTSPERFRGCCFLTFSTSEGMAAALNLSGSPFQGRPMNISQYTKQLERKKALGSVSIYVENLPKEASVQAIRDALKPAFEGCGKFLSVRVATGTKNEGNEGFAWVVFVEGSLDIARAVAMKGTLILGQAIKVKKSIQAQGKRKKDRRLTKPNKTEETKERKITNDSVTVLVNQKKRPAAAETGMADSMKRIKTTASTVPTPIASTPTISAPETNSAPVTQSMQVLKVDKTKRDTLKVAVKEYAAVGSTSTRKTPSGAETKTPSTEPAERPSKQSRSAATTVGPESKASKIESVKPHVESVQSKSASSKPMPHKSESLNPKVESTGGRKAKSRSNTVGQVCFMFESSGSCSRGNECPFVHGS
jgi:hypothetical protein